MASDDDKQWQNAQYDARMRADRARQQTNRLFDAIISGDDDIARVTVRVPPADDGSESSDDWDAPEPTEPPTADELFSEHRHALVFNLELADNFLPKEMLEDWARRVKSLDLKDAAAGLPAIEAIRDEYQRAAAYYEPPLIKASQRIDWLREVPRIGHEIEWLIHLFRTAVPFR